LPDIDDSVSGSALAASHGESTMPAPSHDELLMGVSVFQNGGAHYLRFHLRKPHIKSLGRMVDLSGSPASGFTIAPAKAGDGGLKCHRSSDNLFYVQTTLTRSS